MRHVLLGILRVAALALPAFAEPSGLPFALTLASPLGSAWHKDEVRIGSRFGGISVTGNIVGTSTKGTLTLYAGGRLFILGRYSCASGGCNLNGAVAGKSVSPMRLTSGGWLSDTGNAVSAAFPTHGAWVAAVTEWANANLTGALRAQVLSGIKSDRIQTFSKTAPAAGQKDKP